MEGTMENVLTRIKNHDSSLIAIQVLHDGKLLQKSYGELLNDIKNFGGVLKENKFNHKQIGIIGKNSYQWIVAYFAIITSGNIAVPLDETSIENDFQTVTNNIDFLCIDSDFVTQSIKKSGILYSLLNYETFPETKSLIDPVTDNDSLSTLLFTSGTTGKRKGVIVTNNMRTISVDNTVAMAQLNKDVNYHIYKIINLVTNII
ncbi:hypothetical protein FC70_GL000200 [Paucilactobacillus oligofermentans DSM 15707 = LMG 22743]|uniref:AMP-dependent synthetase/ligase domain-containing protein n=2 Tax=Paucilactobacillus oligofermentans TaxID=293371 RepID=A0A0R1RU61_9LACO|nr:hypothetical protein FC70_GL000200 [Paucilactobacillus oligofermentans DSM 15707 = LMG 22743]